MAANFNLRQLRTTGMQPETVLTLILKGHRKIAGTDRDPYQRRGHTNLDRMVADATTIAKQFNRQVRKQTPKEIREAYDALMKIARGPGKARTK